MGGSGLNLGSRLVDGSGVRGFDQGSRTRSWPEGSG